MVINGNILHERQRFGLGYPIAVVHRQFQPTTRCQMSNFPNTDRGDIDILKVLGFVNVVLGFAAEPFRATQPPHPDMRVQDNYKMAFQETSTGSVGSVYFTTLPWSIFKAFEGGAV